MRNEAKTHVITTLIQHGSGDPSQGNKALSSPVSGIIVHGKIQSNLEISYYT